MYKEKEMIQSVKKSEQSKKEEQNPDWKEEEVESKEEKENYEWILEYLKRGYIDSAKKKQETFSIPQEKLKEASFQVILEHLKRAKIDYAKQIQEAFPIPQEKLKEASFQGVLTNFKKGYFYSAKNIQESEFALSEEDIKNNKEIKKAVIVLIIDQLKEGLFWTVKEIQESEFALSKEDIKNNKEISEAVFGIIIQKLGDNDIDTVLEIQESAFSLSQGEIKENILRQIQVKNIETIKILRKSDLWPEYKILTETESAYIFDAFIETISKKNIKDTLFLQSIFPNLVLSDPQIDVLKYNNIDTQNPHILLGDISLEDIKKEKLEKLKNEVEKEFQNGVNADNLREMYRCKDLVESIMVEIVILDGYKEIVKIVLDILQKYNSNNIFGNIDKIDPYIDIPEVAILTGEAVNWASKHINKMFYSLKPTIIYSAFKLGTDMYSGFDDEMEHTIYYLEGRGIGVASFHDAGENVAYLIKEYNLIHNTDIEIKQYEPGWSGVKRSGRKGLKAISDLEDKGLRFSLLRSGISTTPGKDLKEKINNFEETFKEIKEIIDSLES